MKTNNKTQTNTTTTVWDTKQQTIKNKTIMRESLKTFLHVVIVALIIIVPLILILVGIYLRNASLGQIGFVMFAPWVLCVVYLDEKITDYLNK